MGLNKILKILIIIALIWVAFSISGARILVSEVKVKPGQEYYVEGWGNLGEASQTQLVCRYFNGRKILTKVLWYSSNNILGRDSCPFLYSSQ
ncbi:MAG: hypothetical protein KJI71_01075 [Patescibacteria group bacterium]|nr:hypothetical protein [Patescibacteria group bacterium]